MNINPLEAIQRIVSSGEDAWESIITLANSSENDMSQRRWLIGDLALLVKTEYGKNRVADFATKANLARSTVSQYKNMSAFYPSDIRYVYENLSYSHFRIAYRFKEAALEFLAEACYSSWTIETAQVKAQERLGKKLPPMKLLDAEGCIERVDMMKGTILLSLADGWDISTLDGLQGREVKIRIFEVE
jgi:hypothetical protein